MRGYYASRAAVTRHVRLSRMTRGCNAAHAAFTWLAWLLRVTCGCYTARTALTRHAGLKINMRDLVLLSSVLSSNAVFYF